MKILISLMLIISILCSSCASILTGTKQQVSINSNQQEAKIYVDGNVIGQTPFYGKIPRKTSIIELRKEGYEDTQKQITSVVNPWYWGNIGMIVLFIVPGVVGVIVDLSNGAVNKIDNENIYIDLKEKK